MAVVKDDKIVVAKGYGVRKLGDATPLDENTRWRQPASRIAASSDNVPATLLR